MKRETKNARHSRPHGAFRHMLHTPKGKRGDGVSSERDRILTDGAACGSMVAIHLMKWRAAALMRLAHGCSKFGQRRRAVFLICACRVDDPQVGRSRIRQHVERLSRRAYAHRHKVGIVQVIAQSHYLAFADIRCQSILSAAFLRLSMAPRHKVITFHVAGPCLSVYGDGSPQSMGVGRRSSRPTRAALCSDEREDHKGTP